MIAWLKCLFLGHDWAVQSNMHTEEHDIDVPILWEPPHDYPTLRCKRCGRVETHEICEWFNQHGVSVDLVASTVSEVAHDH